MSSEDNREGIRLSEEGAMTTVEKVSSYDLPDVFAGTDPENLQRMAARLEDRIDELSDEPMNNRNEIQDLAFKAILLTSMADDDSSFRGERVDDEDETEGDEGDDGDDQAQDNGGEEQQPDDLAELEEEVEEGEYEQGEGQDQQDQDEDQEDGDEDEQDDNDEDENDE